MWSLVVVGSLLCALHATAAKYNNEIHTFKMAIAGGIEGRKRKLDFEKVAGEIFRCCISFKIVLENIPDPHTPSRQAFCAPPHPHATPLVFLLCSLKSDPVCTVDGQTYERRCAPFEHMHSNPSLNFSDYSYRTIV